MNEIKSNAADKRPLISHCLNPLMIRRNDVSTLPFSPGDVTAGSENEMQTAVIGDRRSVDLPLSIENSSWFKNLERHASTGDMVPGLMQRIEEYLSGNSENVWENSWVRFPLALLHSRARDVLETDLLSDRKDSSSKLRSDLHRFIINHRGENRLRIPVSYLLKISLADAIYSGSSFNGFERRFHKRGLRMMEHLLNDNTSPETFSFHVVSMDKNNGNGQSLAVEAAMRYLLTQMLVSYANSRFRLDENSQDTVIFSSPHPPVRQRFLNDCVSDSFYRELFMSPCLSGWDRGEDKYHYMKLCHQVLSRSHINAVMKMRDASIITNNLVVLPNTSNISLANNGVHISLGSRKLTELRSNEGSGFSHREEKCLGDLTAKIFEHFLPLFTCTYSAAPYRLAFHDFHPERVLGFLPHELDYTHLRMIWRRWKGCSKNRFMGRSFTPFGPEFLDRSMARILGLKGAFVPDFRLIDYPVALLSTTSSPGQDGLPDNDVRLKEDLHAMGIFDPRMSLYLPVKLRQFDVMGFSGFEARFYSLFENFSEDMAHAAELQMLVTAFAFKLMAAGMISHKHIPDTVFVESERRQIFFGSAIGIPTFFILKNTPNIFMRQILKDTEGIRSSRRYKGYLRVKIIEYRRALIRLLLRDAGDLIEMMGLKETIKDLEARVNEPESHSAAGRITRGILDNCGTHDPFRVSAREFNMAAERYYRTDLRQKQTEEAWAVVEKEFRLLLSGRELAPVEFIKALNSMVKGRDWESFSLLVQKGIKENKLEVELVHRLIILVVMLEEIKSKPWRQKTFTH